MSRYGAARTPVDDEQVRQDAQAYTVRQLLDLCRRYGRPTRHGRKDEIISSLLSQGWRP